MRKRIISLCLALVLCLAMLPVNAMAATPIYLALGDSITTGYKPGTPPGTVDSPFAERIATEQVYDLQLSAVDGQTSEELKEKLTNFESDPILSSALPNAELVTITIGGNDLMNALYDFLVEKYNDANPGQTIDRDDLMAAFLEPQKNPMVLVSIISYVPQFSGSPQENDALNAFGTNLSAVIGTIQQNATNATIIVANQYNPYSQITDSSAEVIVNTFEKVVKQMNAKIEEVVQTQSDPNLKVADIYTAFQKAESNPTNAAFSTSDLQNANLDIHPNQSGHDIIAQTISALLPQITEYGLWVNNVQVTTSNASDVLGDNTVSYDPDTYTLTLNGAHLTESSPSNTGNEAVIYTDSSKLDATLPTVTINIQGENTVTTDDAMGIWNENGSIKLTGTGSLNVTTAKNTAVGGSGLTIDSGIYSLNNDTNGNSIFVVEDDLVITGTAQVIANSYYGIQAGWVDWNTNTYYGGDIIISGDAVVNSTSTDDSGIFTPNNLTIQDNAQVISTGEAYCGLNVWGNAEISGGKVEAYATGKKGEDVAIYVAQNLDIFNDANVVAQSFADDQYGISSGANISIRNTASVKVLEVDGGLYCYGNLEIQDSVVIDCVSLYSEAGNVIVSGNDVQVTAKTKEGSSIPALEAENRDITISGGAYVKATGTMGPGIYAHDAANGVTISGSGTVVETATSDEQSAGIQVMRNGKVTIEDGAVVRTTGPAMGIYSAFAPPSGDSSYPITIIGSWVETTDMNSTRGVGNSVLFEGDAGAVYGTHEVPDGVSISQGKTLTVPEKANLIVPDNVVLVGKGALVVEGTMEIRSGAEFTGAADAAGEIYVFEDDANNPAAGATFSLDENGKVYGQLTQLAGTTINNSKLQTGVNHSYNGTTFANEWSYYVSSSVGPSSPTCSVTLSETENGTVIASPSNATKGDKVTLTVSPEEGYELGTLNVEDVKGNTVALTKASDTEYTFVMPDGNVTVSAAFVEKNVTPFTDVKTADWWYEAVKYVYENKLMAGTSTTIFEPTAKLNRAQAVQILYNLEGQPAVTGTADFTDVSGHWALNAITWGAKNNVVAGVGDDRFDPNADVTREQVAQMMYNYAKFKGYDLSVAGDLNSFSDVSKVSVWAVAALTWANGNELINGHEYGTLEPGGDCTRAQAASILVNFDLNLVKG